MTSIDDTCETVIPMRRPPVRESTLVRSNVAHTFEVFVRTIGAWWPIEPMSFGLGRVRNVPFDARAGGRVYETWDDGPLSTGARCRSRNHHPASSCRGSVRLSPRKSN